MIIAICGFSGSGRSRLANLLAHFLCEGGKYKVSIKDLNSIALRIGFSITAPVTRRIQNKINDILRACYGNSALVTAALIPYANNRHIVIIPDVQTPHELQALIDRGAIIIRIDRPGFSRFDEDLDLDQWTWDEVIGNVGDLDGLKFQAELLAKKLMSHQKFFDLKHELLSRKAGDK